MTDERRCAPMDALLTALGYDADAWTCAWVPLCDDCGGSTVRVEGIEGCRCATLDYGATNTPWGEM